MSERLQYNPDEDPQQRMDAIANAFESQEYERALEEFAAAMTQWAREGRQDAALELAQKVDGYRAKIAENHPDRLNFFETKVAEAYLYASDSENENLTGAEERYQRVATTGLVDVPKNGTLPEVERTKYSEVFHALDRLGDVAFVGGQYQEAGERFADACQKRAEFADDPDEQGPLACAKFGMAASAFMLGEVDKARGLVEEAAQHLEGLEGQELLATHIQALNDAVEEFEALDEGQQERILASLDLAVRQNGGSAGGVKHVDFGELYAEAIKEAEENEG